MHVSQALQRTTPLGSCQKRRPALLGDLLFLTIALAASTTSRGTPASGTGIATRCSRGFWRTLCRVLYSRPSGPATDTFLRVVRVRLNQKTP